MLLQALSSSLQKKREEGSTNRGSEGKGSTNKGSEVAK